MPGFITKLIAFIQARCHVEKLAKPKSMYDLSLRGTQAWSTVDTSLLRTRTCKLSSDRDLASSLILRYTVVVLLNMTQCLDDTGRYWTILDDTGRGKGPVV